MHTLVVDPRYAVRQLGRHPGWALAAILSLGLGIGANTAIFTVINAVLLRPLRYADPESLVGVWASNAHKSERNSVSPAELAAGAPGHPGRPDGGAPLRVSRRRGTV